MRRAVLLLAFGAACVHYKAAPVDMEATVLEAPKPPEGVLPYEKSVEWAVLHNPDLLALRKRAAAVNVSVPQLVDSSRHLKHRKKPGTRPGSLSR